MGMHQRIKKIGLLVLGAIFWIWSATKAAIDWLGRFAIQEDAERAKTMIDQGLIWLFGTPWWVPALLATFLTAALIVMALRDDIGSSQNKSASANAGPGNKEPTEQELPLREVKQRVFKNNEAVEIDGCEFIDCDFQECVIWYSGGKFKIGSNNKMDKTKIKFGTMDQGVQNTLKLLKSFDLVKLNHSADIPAR